MVDQVLRHSFKLRDSGMLALPFLKEEGGRCNWYTEEAIEDYGMAYNHPARLAPALDSVFASGAETATSKEIPEFESVFLEYGVPMLYFTNRGETHNGHKIPTLSCGYIEQAGHLSGEQQEVKQKDAVSLFIRRLASSAEVAQRLGASFCVVRKMPEIGVVLITEKRGEQEQILRRETFLRTRLIFMRPDFSPVDMGMV